MGDKPVQTIAVQPEIYEAMPQAGGVPEMQENILSHVWGIYSYTQWNFTDTNHNAHAKQRQTTAPLSERIHQSRLHRNPETSFCPN